MVDFTESSCLERLGEISGKKLISFDIFTDEKNRKILSLSHKNNSITFHHIEGENDKDLKKSKISSLLIQGHRSPPNCISFNSNSLFFASGSSNEIKIWSFKHRVCTKTLPSENCMCLLYAPGDRYLIAGMESGSIYIYDAVTGDVDQCFQAHNGAINDIKMMPNNQGIASSSSDATVKFWLFDNEIKFSLKLVRQLDMDESVSCVCYSKCQKFIAVSALNDVKIFFDDTLKYYLTLYGHKLSVNSIDISHDNEILITASSDKNIKIWGLNFGECRKSIYAHTSQINKVCFIPQTHFFFSCGKDGSIKLWDGDSFKLIVELKGHHKEVLDFALNKDGDTLISVARDFSLRIWEQSDELIVPETIKEEENADLPNIPLVKEAEKEVLAHMKPTYSSLKYTESLVDSLDIHIKSIENPEDPVHPILLSLNMDPSQYVLHTLSQIPTNELDVSLTTLPYNYVIHLLSIIKEWMIFPNKLELCVRCVSFLIKLHFYQLMNSIELLQQFQDLYTISNDKVTNLKSVIGINMACLNILKRKIEKDTNKFIYDEYLTPKKK